MLWTLKEAKIKLHIPRSYRKMSAMLMNFCHLVSLQ